MARAIFAVGHMLPGVAIYLLGTRVIRMGSGRVPAPVRVLLVVATFPLGRLFHELRGYGDLWLLTGWTLMVAALTTRAGADDDDALARLLPPERPSRAP